MIKAYNNSEGSYFRMNRNPGLGGDSGAAHNVVVDRHKDDTCVMQSMRGLQH